MVVNSTLGDEPIDKCDAPRWPQQSSCGGWGTCIISTNASSPSSSSTPLSNMTILRCECVDGWSGHGETIARDAHDCNININTILALNIIGLLVSIGLMVFCGWALWKMILRSRIQKNTPQGDQQHALAPNNSSAVDSSSSSSSPFRLCYDVLVDPPQRAALLSIIYGLFDFLFFVIKLSGGDPLNGMMVDHRGLAFLWACGCAGFFSFGGLFLWIVVRSALLPLKFTGATQKKITIITRTMRLVLLIMLPIVAFIGQVSMLWLPDMNATQQEIAYGCGMTTLALGSLIVVLTIQIFGKRLITIIDESISMLQSRTVNHHRHGGDARFKAGRHRIQFVTRIWTALGIMGGSMFLGGGVWPWFRYQSAYVVPLSSAFGSACAATGIIVLLKAATYTAPTSGTHTNTHTSNDDEDMPISPKNPNNPNNNNLISPTPPWPGGGLSPPQAFGAPRPHGMIRTGFSSAAPSANSRSNENNQTGQPPTGYPIPHSPPLQQSYPHGAVSGASSLRRGQQVIGPPLPNTSPAFPTLTTRVSINHYSVTPINN